MDTERENIKRNAYHKALQFKNTGLDEEAIYARLEKLGFPQDIAQEVAHNVLLKKKEEKNKEIPDPLNTPNIFARLFRSLFS